MICKIWKLKILSILSYCKQLWRFLVKFLIKNIFLTISFVSRKGICDRIFFFQNTFLQNGENSSKNNSLAREHFSLSVTKSGCTCHPLLFSESHVYNWSHLLEQCVETWRLFQKKFINFWQFFWGRKVKRGQNLFFLKNNSPNGETLPKKEKLGQIRKRERERERELIPKVRSSCILKAKTINTFVPCWILDQFVELGIWKVSQSTWCLVFSSSFFQNSWSPFSTWTKTRVNQLGYLYELVVWFVPKWVCWEQIKRPPRVVWESDQKWVSEQNLPSLHTPFKL